MKFRSQACNFIKKETLTQVFFYEFCEIIKNTFFEELLRATASGIWLFTFLHTHYLFMSSGHDVDFVIGGCLKNRNTDTFVIICLLQESRLFVEILQISLTCL